MPPVTLPQAIDSRKQELFSPLQAVSGTIRTGAGI